MTRRSDHHRSQESVARTLRRSMLEHGAKYITLIKTRGASLSSPWRYEGRRHCDHGKRLARVVVRPCAQGMQCGCTYPLIYMQSRRCIQTAERATRRFSLWRPLCQRLNLSCLHLIVGSELTSDTIA